MKALGDRLLLDSGTLTPLLKRLEQLAWWIAVAPVTMSGKCT
ncbi:putative MarR family regulatory protein [Pseudomonas aeruginosa]|nr:putative MarR family regulatory protein [Pseudomonas aeruginosa]